MRLQPVLFALMLSACASRGPSFLASNAGGVDPSRPSADYGTAHPFLLNASAQDGRWLLACQARTDTDGDGRIQIFFGNHGEIFGDAVRTYLFLEPGAGIPIDALLATDPTGRFLALVRDGTLLLLDLETREEKELASKVTTDPASPEPPVRASFSRDGRQLLFLRPEGSRSVAVVRDLREGTERVLDAGRGRIEQAVLTPSGHWAVLDMVEDDDPEQPWTQQNPMFANNAGCMGPVLSSSSFNGQGGGTSIRRFRRVDGGPFVQGNDVLHPLGRGMLRRAPDSSIVFEDVQGRRETWVPASCNAKLLHVDEARQQVLVACNTRQIMVPLELHGAGVHQSLGWQTTLAVLMSHGIDSGRDGRLVSTEVESKTQPNTWLTLVIDMERRTAHPLSNWGPVTSLGALALLKEGRSSPDDTWTQRLWLWNAETEDKSVLSEAEGYGLYKAGDTVLIMDKWIDLRTGRVLGEVEHAPMAIDTWGRVLRPSPTAVVERGEPLIGPVRWEPALKAPIPTPPAP
ncbi:hypothetical protein [Corallococcus terminator]|uniref:WD40 repeat domain-containing protein n=1 Tax=Corallococcus terminator TaxID=2316733 RepID=A0A3A8JEC2_9BACT|nr:hypothetical protein [Corallococcus terminator]RKG94069.1 hypothetical protein D7V88_00465 [Corallococcus terminator]